MDRYCWPLIRSMRKSCAPCRGLGHLADLAGHLLQLIEIVTENLDGDVGTDAGHHFVDAVGNRLRHDDLHAGHAFSLSRMASWMSSCDQPDGHSPRGFRLTMGSIVRPCGSAATRRGRHRNRRLDARHLHDQAHGSPFPS